MEFPQHSQQLLSALRSQRQRGFLCDCTVMLGPSRFLAHKAVLASCSPFFHMFFSDSAGVLGGNATSSSVTLDCDIVTSAAFGLLLDFVYEGVLQLDESPPVEDVLAAASFLHMNEVVRVCKRRLQRRGPLAEADSTRSEESAEARRAPESGGEGVGDSAAGQAAAMVVFTITGKSQLESVKPEPRTGGRSSDTRVQTPLSPGLADTTQPGMDPHPLPTGGELTHSVITGRSGPTAGGHSGSSNSPSPQQDVPRLPRDDSIRNPSEAGQAPEGNTGASPTTRNERTHPPMDRVGTDYSDGDHLKVKVEAIVISDEELEEKKEERERSVIRGGAAQPSVSFFPPTGHLTHFLPFNPRSPSSSSSGAGPSSQDTSSFALIPPSVAQQQSDPPSYFQDYQDSMENFVEDLPTCGVCGKTFSCSYTLRRHAIVHTRERPYECRYCYRSYTQSGDLYRHIRKNHDQSLPAKRSKADLEPPLPPQPPP
uniref:Zinc finger and BTB domain containing 3 n=1 Tax=Gasterosteus aculeatus TaxID=69293 RepID=G3PXM8_GASAC